MKTANKKVVSAIVALATLSAGSAWGAAFTNGNLVIARVGDGTTALTNSAFGISLLEVSTGGAVAQTIAVPDTGGSALTASGTATSDNKLRSNGSYIALPGYSSALATATVASNTTDARRVLIYGADGAISTTLTFSGGAGAPYSGSNIRGAIPTSDGTAAWTTGNENTTGTPNGVYYISGSGATQLVSGNLRTVDIYSSQLYVSTAAGTTTRVMTVGTGTPTTTGQSLSNLTGLPTTGASYGSFQLFDLDSGVAGVDTLYLQNGNTIEKYSLVSGTWTLNNSTGALTDLMDFTGVASGSTVNLYVVSAANLVSLTDTGGYNANLSSTTFSSSLLAAGSNYAFRGIDFAPAASGTPNFSFTNTSSVTIGVLQGAATSSDSEIKTLQNTGTASGTASLANTNGNLSVTGSLGPISSPSGTSNLTFGALSTATFQTTAGNVTATLNSGGNNVIATTVNVGLADTASNGNGTFDAAKLLTGTSTGAAMASKTATNLGEISNFDSGSTATMNWRVADPTDIAPLFSDVVQITTAGADNTFTLKIYYALTHNSIEDQLFLGQRDINGWYAAANGFNISTTDIEIDGIEYGGYVWADNLTAGTFAVIPEPTSLALLGLGALALATRRRRL